MKIAVIQLNSQDDIEATLETIRMFTGHAVATFGSRFVALPEYALCLTGNRERSAASAQTIGDSAALDALAELAQQHAIHIHLGGVVERAQDGSFYNTSVLFGPDGRILSTYRKIHLFETQEPAWVESVIHNEGAHLTAGESLQTFEAAGVVFGQSICYDLRFPDHFEALRGKGAKVFLAPSAFTEVTGRKDWKRLIQDRARENGAYLVAANQCGLFDNGTYASWGRSMVADQNGDIIVEAGNAPTVLDVTLPFDISK